MQSDPGARSFIALRTALIAAIVIASAALLIAPHPMNFTPIGAVALFSGAYFTTKRAAIAVPLLSLAAGDVFIGFNRLAPYIYASFLLSVTLGFWLRRKKSAGRVGAATLAGAIQFFLVSNFAMWASGLGSYSKNASGLIACYVGAIPLFWNTLAGDAFYAALLFGGMALAEKRFPSLRKPLVAAAGQKAALV